MPPLKDTIRLVSQFGPSLLDGTISNEDLGKLWNSFKATVGYRDKAKSYNDTQHTTQEALSDFVNYIGPYFSLVKLHKLNSRLLDLEIKKNALQALRGSTLAKVFLVYEAKRLNLCEGKLEKLETGNFDALFDIQIPDALKNLYHDNIVSNLEQTNPDTMYPEPLEKSEVEWAEQMDFRYQSIGEHFLFNVFKSLLNNEIEQSYASNSMKVNQLTLTLAGVMNKNNSAYRQLSRTIGNEIDNFQEPAANIKLAIEQLQKLCDDLLIFVAEQSMNSPSITFFFNQKGDLIISNCIKVIAALGEDLRDPHAAYVLHDMESIEGYVQMIEAPVKQLPKNFESLQAEMLAKIESTRNSIRQQPPPAISGKPSPT